LARRVSIERSEARNEMRVSDKRDKAVLVVGLGRFGSALADTLVRLDFEVLGIDADPKIVAYWAGRLTHVVEADSTSEDALRQLGCGDVRRAVIGIGTHIEASILTTSVLIDLGVEEIWAKAVTVAHGRILQRVGAHHVVFPEHAVGVRVAHQVTGQMMDYIEFDPDLAMVKTRAPRELAGKTLGESGLRAKHRVTVVGIKKPGTDFTHATGETQVDAGDILIVSGKPTDAEKFATRV